MSRSAPEAWRVQGRTAESFIDRRRASAPPRRVPASALDCLGLCWGKQERRLPCGCSSGLLGSGSEAALQAALHAQGFIVSELVHEAPFLGPSEMLWFGLLRALRMKPLLLTASGSRPRTR